MLWLGGASTCGTSFSQPSLTQIQFVHSQSWSSTSSSFCPAALLVPVPVPVALLVHFRVAEMRNGFHFFGLQMAISVNLMATQDEARCLQAVCNLCRASLAPTATATTAGGNCNILPLEACHTVTCPRLWQSRFIYIVNCEMFRATWNAKVPQMMMMMMMQEQRRKRKNEGMKERKQTKRIQKDTFIFRNYNRKQQQQQSD